MPSLMWAILCESCLIDSESNNVSLINVIEQLNVAELPTVIQAPLTIVSLWKRSIPPDGGPEPFSFRYTLVTPSGERFEPDWRDIEIPMLRLRDRSRIGAIPLQNPGTYSILVEVRTEGSPQQVGSMQFEVTAAGALQ